MISPWRKSQGSEGCIAATKIGPALSSVAVRLAVTLCLHLTEAHAHGVIGQLGIEALPDLAKFARNEVAAACATLLYRLLPRFRGGATGGLGCFGGTRGGFPHGLVGSRTRLSLSLCLRRFLASLLFGQLALAIVFPLPLCGANAFLALSSYAGFTRAGQRGFIKRWCRTWRGLSVARCRGRAVSLAQRRHRRHGGRTGFQWRTRSHCGRGGVGSLGGSSGCGGRLACDGGGRQGARTRRRITSEVPPAESAHQQQRCDPSRAPPQWYGGPGCGRRCAADNAGSWL